MSPHALTLFLKQRAHELGFEEVGVAAAERLDDEARRLAAWLEQGRHGTMTWMENHFEKRVDPRELVPGAKSVVMFSFNYYNPEVPDDPDAPRIARYAYGRDYHKVLKKKLKQLLSEIRSKVGDVQGRCFADSAPVLERAWAQRSGVGWIGKNTLVLTKGKGSYFVLGTMILDVELVPDGPVTDYCGRCTRCIDACPTDALTPYEMDATRCISYLTIERQDDIPAPWRDQLEGFMFGCDICQEVCPINARASMHDEPDFLPRPGLLDRSADDWLELTEEVFDEVFHGTPVKRAGFEKLKRTIQHVANPPS